MSVVSLLTQSMSVFIPDTFDGDFTVLETSDVACRLSMPGGGTAAMVSRAELLRMRVLYYDTTYTMPAEAQVLIDGEQWNVQRGTEQAPTDPRTQLLVYRAVDVMRAQT